MLKRHLLDDDSVLFNFEFMAWLIREFGAPHAPPVPLPLHRSEPLYHRHWSENDQRTVYVWVEDELCFLKARCHMEHWHVIARPIEDNPPVYDGDTPVIAYDPKRCAEPGYFTAQVLIRLSEVLIDSKLDVDNLADTVLQQLKILTICFLGQGLTLAALPSPYLADLMPRKRLNKSALKRTVNCALFGTALCLSCRRFSMEHLVQTYGPIITKQTYKGLWGGFQQIKAYETELDTLKMLIGKGQHGQASHENIVDFRQRA